MTTDWRDMLLEAFFCARNNQLRTGANTRESDCSGAAKPCDRLKGVETMWFLPSALNVKEKEFTLVRVSGG